MGPLFASIAAGDRTVAGVLAAEALRHAATANGTAIDIEVSTTEGVLNPLVRSQMASGGTLLAVGSVNTADLKFAGLHIVPTGLDQVLADPHAALVQALHSQPPASEAPALKPQRIVAITSCPTGIAHTFMAAEGLQQAAKELGIAMRVETQGSVGAQDALTDAEIAEADVVIIAADRQVELGRFAGKRVLLSGTKPAINNGKVLIRRALAEAQVQERDQARGDTSAASKPAATAKPRTGPYKHLMTGVSFMLPFITAGGLLIALAFAFGGIYAYQHSGTAAHSLMRCSRSVPSRLSCSSYRRWLVTLPTQSPIVPASLQA